jgi:hypothetical protein
MRSATKKLLYVAVALLAVLVLVELAYRWIDGRREVVPRRLGRYDRSLGWSLEPGANASSSVTGQRIDYRINSKGLRDDETPYEKPPGVYRIVLLGDSRTFGYGVPIEKHFSKYLEGYFDRVEVINMGVSGYGVDQELISLRSEGFRYQPDLVIAYVAHFGNHRHMHSNLWGKHKPYFVLQDGELVLKNNPVPGEYEGLSLLRKIDVYLVNHSPLYRDLSPIAVSLLKRGSLRPTAYGAKTMKEKDLEDPTFEQRMYELAEAILGRIGRESVKHGARFLLVTEIERLRQECAQLGLTTLDVYEPLRNPAFQLPHGLQHINEAGNGVLAWELAKFLRESGIVPQIHWKTETERQNVF